MDNTNEARNDTLIKKFNKTFWLYGRDKPAAMKNKITKLSDPALEKLAKTGIYDFESGGEGTPRELQIKLVGRELKRRFGSIPKYFVKEASEFNINCINNIYTENNKGTLVTDKNKLDELLNKMVIKSLSEKTKYTKATDKTDDGEGMDPVGKGDADIDNDGDSDESDAYLKKRRSAISKSVKKEDVDLTEATTYTNLSDWLQAVIAAGAGSTLSQAGTKFSASLGRNKSATFDLKKQKGSMSESLEEGFKKGDSVKVKNAKSYNSLAKDEVMGTIYGMDGDKVKVKVGTGSMTVDIKDLMKESLVLEGAIGDYKELIKFANSDGGADKGDMLKAAALMAKGDKEGLKKLMSDLDKYPRDVIKSYAD